MRIKKRGEGFTLVEVIISIGVLSIASVFILQMFVTSAQLNANARDIDKVNMWTSTLMETFHLEDDPAAFADNPVFTHPIVQAGGEATTIICRFDKDWQPVEGEEGAKFRMTAVVTHEEDGPETATGLAEGSPTVRGALYTIAVEFHSLDAGGRDVLLGSTSNTNYFQIEEASP